MTSATRIPVEGAYKVTSLELFFDLVFVFAITQLTGLLAGEIAIGGANHLLIGLCRVLPAFGVLWWIYGGYAWLTNTVPPSSAGRRILLLVGMAGFLIVALATPHAFGSGGDTPGRSQYVGDLGE